MRSLRQVAATLISLLWLASAVALDRIDLDRAHPVILDEFAGGVRPVTQKELSLQQHGVSIEGQAVLDYPRGSIRLSGAYRTTQPEIVPGTNLSFQVYDAEGALLQFENPRASLVPSEQGGYEADFDFSIYLDQLDLEFDEGAIAVRFNYVLEHQYWYHEEHPELANPVLLFRNLPRIPRFETISFYYPPIAPADTPSRAWALVKIKTPNPSKPIPYSFTIEAFTPGFDERIENRRVALPPNLQGPSILTSTIKASEPTTVMARPGFVWEGVKWYDAGSEESYRKIRFVSPLAYLLVACLALIAAAFLFEFASAAKSKPLRLAGRLIALALAAILFATLVTNRFWILFALALACCLAIRYAVPPRARFYAAALAPLVLLECYWSFLYAQSAVRVSAFLFSAWLYALLLSPLLLMRRRWLKIGALVAIAGASISFHIWINLYHEFFEDYPSFSSLMYSNQLAGIADSVVLLLDSKHYAMLLFWIPSLAWLAWETWRGRADRADRPKPVPAP